MKIKFIISLIVTALFMQSILAQALQGEVQETNNKSDIFPPVAPDIQKHHFYGNLSTTINNLPLTGSVKDDFTNKSNPVSFVTLLKP